MAKPICLSEEFLKKFFFTYNIAPTPIIEHNSEPINECGMTFLAQYNQQFHHRGLSMKCAHVNY
jgi:hypothetical protein